MSQLTLLNALLSQGVTGSIRGSVPTDPSQITQAYLDANFTVGEGTVDVTLLQADYSNALRSAEVDRINTERAARLERLTVEYQGNTYDADAAAQANVNRVINGVTARLALPQTINWRDADNVTRTLTQNDVFRLGELMLMHVQIIYETSWALKEAIEAAPTLEAAQAITWPE